MKKRRIKSIRFSLQLLFFITGIMLLWGHLLPGGEIYDALHVMPFLAAFFSKALPALWGLTLIILVLPLFLGRLYCSYICPVGFWQDLFIKLARKLKIRPRFWPLRLTALIILVVTLGFLLVKSPSYQYFDHFTNFSRLIFTAKSLFSGLPFHSSFFVALGFLLLITLPTFWIPRFFCQLCPSGTLFSFFQKKSMLKLECQRPCEHCGRCEHSCYLDCIQKGAINQNTCIGCLECVGVCPSWKISFHFPRWPRSWWPKKEKHTDPLRRQVIKTIPLWSLAIIFPFKKSLAPSPLTETSTVLPPGAQNAATFFSKCTECGKCFNVCPTRVMKPKGFEDGYLAWGKPSLDYQNSYCEYECNACMEVCPTGALLRASVENKKLFKLGEVYLFKERCIPYKEKRDCSACAEHCPTGAITTVRQNGALVPVVEQKLCIGCGACQHICPVNPKAIRVSPLSHHTLAYNAPKKEKSISATPSEFPF
jgi:ferredoxin